MIYLSRYIVNSYLIYKKNYAVSEVTIVQCLLFETPFEKLKSGMRQKFTNETKDKLTYHKLEEKKGSARIFRSRCADHYEKARQQQQREASNNYYSKENQNRRF